MPLIKSARITVKAGFRERERNLKSFKITNAPITNVTNSQPKGPTANTAEEKTGNDFTPCSENSDRNLGMMRKTIRPHKKYAPANILV